MNGKHKNQKISSEVKNTIAEINNSVEEFISRSDSNEKGIKKWKINQN